MEREEAEALWAGDGPRVVKEEQEANATPGRNARSAAPTERRRGHGRVNGRKDEL